MRKIVTKAKFNKYQQTVSLQSIAMLQLLILIIISLKSTLRTEIIYRYTI